MTIVLGARFLTETLVIADSRISYGENSVLADDILQKLYPIGGREMGFLGVIGFSGPLEGAYHVLTAVRQMMRRYNKRQVVSSVMDDLVRYIRRAYTGLNPPLRNGFLIAGVEPSRNLAATGPKWLPYMPQVMIWTLLPSDSKPGTLQLEKRGLVRTIGIRSPEFLTKLQEQVMQQWDTQYKYPEAGTRMLLDDLMLEFLLTDSRTVGGLFQCASLTRNGLRMYSYAGTSGLSLLWKNGRYFLTDEKNGIEQPLLNIFEWGEKQQDWRAGQFGTIEDHWIREAADHIKHRREEEE